MENENNYIKSIELINKKLIIILKKYDRTELYASSLEEAIKKESQKASTVNKVQKSVDYLNRKKWLASRVVGVAGGTAATVATGVVAGTAHNALSSLVTTPMNILVQSSGFLKPILEPLATGVTGYINLLSITTGVMVTGVIAYFCFRFVYHFLRKVSGETIRRLNEKYGFDPNILEWLPTENLLFENPLFRLQCLLLTLSIVSKLESEFDKRSIDLNFDIEKLVNNIDNDKETLSWEEEKIYNLVKEDAKAFVDQIKEIVKSPNRIDKLKKSSTYKKLIEELQATSSINFNDDRKTSTYLAITSHVIDQRCDPRQSADFFYLLKAAFCQHLPSQPKTFMESSHTTSNPRSNPAIRVSHNQNDRDSQNESNLPNRSNGLHQYGHFKNNSNHRRETTLEVTNIYHE